MRAAWLLSIMCLLAGFASLFGYPAIRYEERLTGIEGFLVSIVYAAIPPLLVFLYRKLPRFTRKGKGRAGLVGATKRPVGMTVLCVLLASLSVAGAANAYLILTDQFGGLPIYLGVFAAGYSIAALLACIGLWRMRYWGLYALRTWMGICLAMVAAMTPVFRHIALGGVGGIAGFALMTVVLFWILNGYATLTVSGARNDA